MTPHLADTPVLETPRLVLRAPVPDDLPAWSAFMAGPRSHMAGGPLDAGRAWRAFGHLLGHWVMRGFGQFVAVRRDTGRALGTCGAHFPADWPEREIGWTIWSAADEGQGLAREAALAVRAHVYATLGWTTAVSYIDPANARSIALAERLGAVPDPAATPPAAGTLVYRHPAPEARA